MTLCKLDCLKYAKILTLPVICNIVNKSRQQGQAVDKKDDLRKYPQEEQKRLGSVCDMFL